MDTIQLLGSTLGLGFMAGMRLYSTVVAIGLGIRFGWLTLPPQFSDLRILGEPIVLIPAAIIFAIEFISDKIPWVDSAWDSVHTFIRPVGAALLAATALGSLDPAVKWLLVLLTGGIALTSHSSKAATRLAVNHSPEPVSNIGLSLAGDFFVPVGVWVAMEHPGWALAGLILFLVVFLWLSPKVIRMIKLQLTALKAWVQPSKAPVPQTRMPIGIPPAALQAFSTLRQFATPVPAELARLVPQGAQTPMDLRLSGPLALECAASRNIPGMGHSIGQLIFASDELVFAAQRMFRRKTYRIPFEQIQEAQLKRGIFLNKLVVRTAKGESTFLLFKNLDIRGARRAAENSPALA